MALTGQYTYICKRMPVAYGLNNSYKIRAFSHTALGSKFLTKFAAATHPMKNIKLRLNDSPAALSKSLTGSCKPKD